MRAAEIRMENVVSSRMRTSTPMTVAPHVFAATPAYAAPYVVEGMTLGERIPLNTPNYRSYKCERSERFKDYTWCERTQPRRTGGGSLATTIMHAEDGTAVYLMAKHAPIAVDRASVQRAIDDLSRTMNERPTKVEWVPARPGLPPSVIAAWGRVELRKLRPDEVETISDDDNLHLGVVVDSSGDLPRAAKAGLAIYRVGGAAGLVYTASFDAGNRGHRRYVAVDVSQPALKKFEPALHEVLQKDKSLAADDYSLWPEV